MAAYEIFVNRRGINSIEIPRQVEVNAGEELILRLVNKGHPTHVSISATNQQLFTDFIHENLYVEDEATFGIPIKEGPYTGVFDLEVITGYGTRRGLMKVYVTKKPEASPAAEKKPEPQKSMSLAKLELPLLQWLVLALGVILLLAWIALRADIIISSVDNLLILALILILAGAFFAWFSRR